MTPNENYSGETVCDHGSRHRNKCRWSSSFIWIIFNLQQRKIVTVLYSDAVMALIHSETPWNLNAKSPSLRAVAVIGQHKLQSSLVPCWISTAPFPTSHWLHPFLRPGPFLPPTHTCNTIFLSTVKAIPEALSSGTLTTICNSQVRFFFCVKFFYTYLQSGI